MASKKVARKIPKKKATAKKPARSGAARGGGFSPLERNILQGKGVTAGQLKRILQAGIRAKQDFHVVGDAATLVELTGMEPAVAARVMAWATGGSTGGAVVIEGGDVVNCVACGKRQPKDYKSGDLCVFCGKQAEPVFACYWCAASGPGRHCRACGAIFVSPGELELAILLKRDGLSKEEIPPRLESMDDAEKQVLWGRVSARR